jgi:serine protease AprX
MKATKLYGVIILLAVVISTPMRAQDPDPGERIERCRAKCSERLARILESSESDEPIKLWIYFRDHGPFRLRKEEGVSERSLVRRRIRSGSETDRFDLPVYHSYISTVRASGAKLRHVSRYFNAVSALVEPSRIEEISSLRCVVRMDVVGTYRRALEEKPDKALLPTGVARADIYGESYEQLAQIGSVPLLELGYNGSGSVTGSDPVLVCVMDTGFRLEHEALTNINVIAQYDFVQGDTIVRNEPEDAIDQDRHGTIILGALAGYHAGDLVGPAWGADFLLAKTEITGTEIEIEEDNWVAGIEWADSAGAEIVSSSLGYIKWYYPEDLDGNTPLCTRAADIAAAHGIIVVTAMGNYGPGDTTLIAPADGDSVIAVGAVDRGGIIAYFSSRGPTADGRIKPDLVALGSGTRSVDYTTVDSYASSSGTSLSTPLVAGLCAQLLEIMPELTPFSMWELLTSTSSKSEMPDNAYGYGLPNGAAAAGIEILQTTIALGGAYPNPFMSRTSFDLVVPPGEPVTVRIFDCRGGLVRELPTGATLSQGGVLVWDGTNSEGSHVATGVYFARISAGSLDRTIKLLLIR